MPAIFGGIKVDAILEEFLPYDSAVFGFLECLYNMFLIGCKCLTAFFNSSSSMSLQDICVSFVLATESLQSLSSTLNIFFFILQSCFCCC